MENFTLIEQMPTHILIKDTGIGKSITNSAEQVIEYLYNTENILEGIRCFYIDTEGRVDELLHAERKFIGFKPGYENITEFNLAKKNFEIDFSNFEEIDEDDF